MSSKANHEALSASALAAGSAYKTPEGVLVCALCNAEVEWEDCSACGGDHFCPTREYKTVTCQRVIGNAGAKIVGCKYCGARLRRDTVGQYCPTKNCQWQHGVPASAYSLTGSSNDPDDPRPLG